MSPTAFALNVGWFASIAPGEETVSYVYFGPGFYVPLTDHLGLIPSATFEVAPGSGAWGFVGAATLDLRIGAHTSLNLSPSIAQDTSAFGTVAVLGLGPGISYTLDSGLSLSVGVPAALVLGPDVLVLNPGLNLSVPFP
jgi:hypothetical protein